MKKNFQRHKNPLIRKIEQGSLPGVHNKIEGEQASSLIMATLIQFVICSASRDISSVSGMWEHYVVGHIVASLATLAKSLKIKKEIGDFLKQRSHLKKRYHQK